jgi:hypothetical protein
VLLIFAGGAVLTALVAIGYAGLVRDPAGLAAAAKVDIETARRAAVEGAVIAGCASGLHLVALAGLALGRIWGRVVGTLVCAGWCLTLVGAPFSLLVLLALWRRSRLPDAGPAPANPV